MQAGSIQTSAKKACSYKVTPGRSWQVVQGRNIRAADRGSRQASFALRPTQEDFKFSLYKTNVDNRQGMQLFKFILLCTIQDYLFILDCSVRLSMQLSPCIWCSWKFAFHFPRQLTITSFKVRACSYLCRYLQAQAVHS